MKLAALFVFATLAGGAPAALACPGHGGQTAAAKAAVGDVALADLAAWVEKKEATVVDANKKETWAAGHIPGAVHATAATLTVAALPADKAAKLVFYCYNEQCGAAPKAAAKAVELGYTNVFVYKGGIEGWKKAGKAVEVAEVKAAGTEKKQADG